MAKIIKHGQYPEKNKVTCDSCGCVFKYFDTEVDVSMTTPDEESFFGGFACLKYIKCPDCKHTITLEYNFIESKSWLDRVFDKMFKGKKEDKCSCEKCEEKE